MKTLAALLAGSFMAVFYIVLAPAERPTLEQCKSYTVPGVSRVSEHPPGFGIYKQLLEGSIAFEEAADRLVIEYAIAGKRELFESVLSGSDFTDQEKGMHILATWAAMDDSPHFQSIVESCRKNGITYINLFEAIKKPLP